MNRLLSPSEALASPRHAGRRNPRVEQRAYPRFPQHLPVLIDFPRHPSVRGHTIELGLAGALVVTDDPIPRHDVVTLRLHSPAHGELWWPLAGIITRRLTSGVAIAFVDLDPENDVRIVELLLQHR